MYRKISLFVVSCLAAISMSAGIAQAAWGGPGGPCKEENEHHCYSQESWSSGVTPASNFIAEIDTEEAELHNGSEVEGFTTNEMWVMNYSVTPRQWIETGQILKPDATGEEDEEEMYPFWAYSKGTEGVQKFSYYDYKAKRHAENEYELKYEGGTWCAWWRMEGESKLEKQGCAPEGTAPEKAEVLNAGAEVGSEYSANDIGTIEVSNESPGALKDLSGAYQVNGENGDFLGQGTCGELLYGVEHFKTGKICGFGNEGGGDDVRPDSFIKSEAEQKGKEEAAAAGDPEATVKVKNGPKGYWLVIDKETFTLSNYPGPSEGGIPTGSVLELLYSKETGALIERALGAGKGHKLNEKPEEP